MQTNPKSVDKLLQKEEGWYAGSVQVITFQAQMVATALSPLAQNKIIVPFFAFSLDWESPGWTENSLC